MDPLAVLGAGPRIIIGLDEIRFLPSVPVRIEEPVRRTVTWIVCDSLGVGLSSFAPRSRSPILSRRRAYWRCAHLDRMRCTALHRVISCGDRRSRLRRTPLEAVVACFRDITLGIDSFFVALSMRCLFPS